MSYKSALDDLFGFHDLKRSFFDDAEVAERLNAPVLKTGGSYGSEGSFYASLRSAQYRGPPDLVSPSFSVEKCRLGVIGSPPVPNTGDRHDLGVRVSQAAFVNFMSV